MPKNLLTFIGLTCCGLLLSFGSITTAHGEALEGTDGLFSRLDFKPFYLETDVGKDDRARKRFGSPYAKTISRNLDFFLKAFNMKASDFTEYAKFYGAEEGNFDPWIRIRLWRSFEPFLADLQKRYDTKAIAGAFKGNIRPVDEYGEPDGPRFREIGTYVGGQSKEAILRLVYHEMGHLFMETFLLYPAEVPSWIEEGTAQLFQYRKGNGTKPDAERLERISWAYEMVKHNHDFGRAIPWKELTVVRNLDNLDFTYQSPLRSSQQYIQVWLMSEFFINDSKRARAYFKMLNGLKDAAKARLEEVWAASNGNMSEKQWADYRMYLYSIQLRVFKESYGRDIFEVEGFWEEWLEDEYKKLVKRKPEMRYYRGTWHLDNRARHAPSPEVRKDAMDTAEKIFQQAIAANAKDPSGHVGMARLELAKGNSDKANEHFAEATKLGSDFFEALVYGGQALIQSGDALSAVEGLEKALKERPAHWDATSFLGQALIISGEDMERGISLIRSAVNQRPGSFNLRLYEGVAYYLLGDYNSAAQNFADVFVSSGNRSVLAAAGAAISRSRQMEDDEVARWIGFVRNTNPQVADQLQEILVTQRKTIPLGFSSDGRPAIVGLTVPPEEAIIPTPKRSKKKKK